MNRQNAARAVSIVVPNPSLLFMVRILIVSPPPPRFCVHRHTQSPRGGHADDVTRKCMEVVKSRPT
jgi:hypothetical protein